MPVFSTAVARHGVGHHTVTVGPSAFAQARCLDVKSTSWALPLHMVPKADGGIYTFLFFVSFLWISGLDLTMVYTLVISLTTRPPH